MKNTLFIIFFLFSFSIFAQETKEPKNTKILEVACGQCQFAMEGHACDLAVRIDGKSYFVTGTNIDSHGDAHAKDGFCSTIRQAKVAGEIVDDKYVVTYFELLPEKTK